MSSGEPESIQSIPTDSHTTVYLGETQKIQLCMQDLFPEFPSPPQDAAVMNYQRTGVKNKQKNPLIPHVTSLTIIIHHK